MVDSVDGTTTVSYNAEGRPVHIVYPDGHGLGFAYDGFGRRIQRTNSDGSVLNYAYDNNGRFADLTDGAGHTLVQYTYDAAGRLLTETKGNGLETVYGYDAAGRIASLTNQLADASTVSFFNYTYDPNNNISSMTTSQGTTAYSYDADSQLQSASYPSGRTAGYTYDAAGNRESYNNNGTNITYAANSMNEYTQAGGVTLLYDADGNLTNRTDSSGTTRYQYDAEDHLISVTTPDLQTVQYAYNGLGQRT